MFGKHFETMYTGSMMGAGAVRFAVWGYVIATWKPESKDGEVIGGHVEINPKLLAVLIGEPEEAIQSAVEWLCSPDPKSRSKAEEGRRLVRLGEYEYRVVNGAKYHKIRNQIARREQTRLAQQRHRKKGKNANKPLPGELGYLRTGEMPHEFREGAPTYRTGETGVAVTGTAGSGENNAA